MKRFTGLLCIGAVGIAAMCAFRASADLEVSGSVSISATADFHAPLATHGAWIEVGSYGRCWRPASVSVEWRPYAYGHWVWTDCGWYWASDEPWAWACYHYGSWAYESGYGWVWVPGIEWAPAWVSWRFGGGYCGWAPLGPRGVVVAPALFVFVEAHRFHEPIRPRTVIVNNTTIINRTTVINNMRSETRTFAEGGTRKVMVNEGPGAAAIERASNKKLTKVSVTEAARKTPVPQTVARKSGESRTQDSGDVKAKGGNPRSAEQAKPGAGPERRVHPGTTPSVPKGHEKKADQRPNEPKGGEKRDDAGAEEPREEGKKNDAVPNERRGNEKKADQPDGSQPPDQPNPPSRENVAPGKERPQQPQRPGKPQRPKRGQEKGQGKGQGADQNKP